ncbi:Electron transfer protein 1, mitochondrial [Hypsizygus marmoreus]|uniref:Electron transfer protein 1, mitochondrial n=1 Tax=Hypsizygus marmoreus TaxID=39966 RepID=A0A369JWZ9_HYPMA|nr:Electron transfer protein 1, mitochondrial [Hypsizygus marmoreus]
MLLAALSKAARLSSPTKYLLFSSTRRLTSQLTRRPSRTFFFSTPPPPKPTPSRILSQTRFFSSAPPPAPPLPILTPKSVGAWLMVSSTLVFAIVVVGGVTRLTESGLSITEWRPITGILPPLTHDQWTAEFEKYKATPEFKLLNSSITLDDFKFIFSMEWGHRLLGRVLGIAFVGPLIYFAARRKISLPLFLNLFGLGTLIGAQGLLGWYMVQSGLEDAILTTPGAVPRVSQYRLAAHLGLALALYAGMFGAGMAAIKDWKFAKGAPWSGVVGKGGKGSVQGVLMNPAVRSFKRNAWALTGLVFLTALSGAFVAGLDAGLLYNEFPLMGGRLAPPADELFSPDYAKNADKSDLWWRNIFENPTTVQFNHRVLATTTYFATLGLLAQSLRPALKATLPPLTHLATKLAFGMANIQVLLGISTLLYLVPVPLAAAHQAGSVMLLSAMMHVLVTLRRPGLAARVWRKVNLGGAPAKRRKY